MLLDIIGIVVRETLEAGVLFCLLLCCIRFRGKQSSRLFPAFILGILGAVIYAASMATVSDWFDGVGQEVLNATLQIIIFICLSAIVFLYQLPCSARVDCALRVTTVLAAATALTREGAELIILYSGYWYNDITHSALSGGIIGLTIGTSVGIISYYLLMLIPRRAGSAMLQLCLILIGSGMCLQAVKLLNQADWIEQTIPLWNTNNWLNEQSLAGQFCYAIFGYEAAPNLSEVSAYSIALLLFSFAIFSGQFFDRKPHEA